jgi:GNAT superfamily N-acetyltransferase
MISRDRSSAIQLVDFEPHWLDELVRMWRASFEAGVGISDPHPIEEQKQFFLDVVLPQNAVRIALKEGRIVGFVAASSDTVDHLYVHVDHHRQGIGTLMLDWAKSQSSGRLRLFTFARNQGARSFYERNGFVEIAHGFEPVWQLEDVTLEWTDRATSPPVSVDRINSISSLPE